LRLLLFCLAVHWCGVRRMVTATLIFPAVGTLAERTLLLSYRATVLSANGTPIINSVYTDWASLNGGVVGERNGAGCPNVIAPDTYCAGPAISSVTSLDPTALAKAVASDSWTTAPSTASDATLRVGDTVVYTLTATLREGTTQNVVISDTLPAGMVFDSVVSITASVAPFTYNSFSGPVLSGNTITWNLGNITNAVDNNALNNGFVIQYRARVVNTLAQASTTPLTNNATLSYAISGVAGTQKTASIPISVWQPLLSVSKSAAPAGGDTVLVAGELVNYTVKMQNAGSAPAYNAVLQDTLPLGMRNSTPVSVSTWLDTSGPTACSVVGTLLPNVMPSYSSGVATWNFVSAVAEQYAIAPGKTLCLLYQARADADVGAGMTLNNTAQIQHYYSLDNSDPNVASRKDYGASNTAVVQLTTASANALAKQSLKSNVAIGEPFTYRMTIPAAAQATALNDVQVTDNLAYTGVTLTFLSASARLASNVKTWASLNNTGSASNLVLQDTIAGGLDIPANDQLIVDVVVILNNDPINNTTNKQFSNSADYTYNRVNNDLATQANGGPGASGAVTIIAPALVATKAGPATMRVGVAEDFSIRVQNNGAATAWNIVVSDVLPNVTTAPSGGMCGSAPAAVRAQLFDALGNAASALLIAGTDFSAPFTPAPGCTLSVNLPSTLSIPQNYYVLVSYQATLDPGSSAGMNLDNFAGATSWMTANPAVTGAAPYVQTVTNQLTTVYATAKASADFQDAWRVTTEAPVVTFTKEVFNRTTNQSGVTARPGDTLRYRLTIKNISTLAAANFALTDDLDSLNTPAMFVQGSLNLVTVPAGADIALTSMIGGLKGTGFVSVRGLNIAAQGLVDPLTGVTDTVVIEYDVTLVPVINNGIQVRNQASIGGTTLPAQLSDDPLLAGATDPTITTITSAPSLRVHKTVQDLTGDPLVVQPGDTLRYTITINNTGTENAKSVSLRDLLPENTTYVAQSTRLNNGAPLADIVINNITLSPLHNGIAIHPLNGVAGEIPADASLSAANTVTVTFDVRVAGSTLSGTVISNQAFVNGTGEGGLAFLEKPSDNPATSNVADDPTLSIVGNLPLLNVQKTVAITPVGDGVLTASEYLRYTITISNLSAIPATGVMFTDPIPVPGNFTYIAGTTTLNGVAVADLGAGIAVNSSGSATGVIAGLQSAVITFDVQVSATVVAGDVISNQGSVTSNELPSQLTDADGNSINGYQPTTIVVGSGQQVQITKQVSVIGGGAALPAACLSMWSM
jgi:large repetitive protein